jgi:CRISPR/Cas system CSM-associated protein Csm2 small subunit
MNALTAKPAIALQRRRAAKKISALREAAEDLVDSLDLLAARAKDDGKRHSIEEVRRRLQARAASQLPLKK